ncbi:hypothetical protein T03_18144 [Trichinella britovi]|uniref:Uncharacterized protein n=1 Tax=Trichinella britovi TaxID=45882 RepID=A0A0V1D7W0_TRIBR|nr:hypothetical protein T03_18144 [Trichinella britovi]
MKIKIKLKYLHRYSSSVEIEFRLSASQKTCPSQLGLQFNLIEDKRPNWSVDTDIEQLND